MAPSLADVLRLPRRSSMGADRYSRRSTRVDDGREPGLFVALPHSVLNSEAYLGLSDNARALMIELALQLRGENNGKLLLSRAHLKPRGWNSSDMLTKGKKELLEAGLIFETVMGCRPNKASWYAVTWYRLGENAGFDYGAVQGFRRGAYRKSSEQFPSLAAGKAVSAARPPSPARADTSLRPSGGTGGGPIVPAGGTGPARAVPSHGAIAQVSTTPSVPQGGHHLEEPSAADGVRPLSGQALPDLNQTETLRESLYV
jgi:hypothetical protein